MGNEYRTEKKILASELFDGRLKKFDIHEHDRGHGRSQKSIWRRRNARIPPPSSTRLNRFYLRGLEVGCEHSNGRCGA